MDDRSKGLVLTFAAFLLGVLAGFFALFNVLFSDSFGVLEKAWGVAYVLGVYAVAGGSLGSFRPPSPTPPYLALVVPGLLIALVYVVSDGLYTLHAFSAILAAIVGGLALPLAKRWRDKATARARAGTGPT